MTILPNGIDYKKGIGKGKNGMETCGNCGAYLQPGAAICPHCHVPVGYPAMRQATAQTPTQQAPVAQPGPQSGKKQRKKRRFGCLSALSLFLLLVLGYVGFATVKGKMDANRDIKREERYAAGEVLLNTEDKLLQAFNEGSIDADTFIRQMACSIFEPESLGNKYRSDAELSFAPDLIGYVEEHYDELSEETLEFVARKILFADMPVPEEADIAASTSESETSALVCKAPVETRALAQTVEAENAFTAIRPPVGDPYNRQYVFSPQKRFVVWYFTSGDYAIADEQASEIAELLDKYVNLEEEFLGREWTHSAHYSSSFSIDGLYPTAQNDPDEKAALASAMPVYIADSTLADERALAWYLPSTDWKVVDALMKWATDEMEMKYIHSIPYVMIRYSSLTAPEDLAAILSHELVHHFQALDGFWYDKGVTCEAEANLVAACVVNQQEMGLFNRHANDYMAKTNKSLWYYERGYELFLFAYSYMITVPHGLEKIRESWKQDFPFLYLEEEAFGLYPEVMEDLTLRNLTKEYLTNSFVAQGVPPPEFEVSPTCLHVTDLPSSSIDYYYVDMAMVKRENMNISLGSNGGKFSYLLIGNTNVGNQYGSGFELIEKGDIDINSGKRVIIDAENEAFKGYGEVVVAVVNGSAFIDAIYNIQSETIELKELLDTNDLQAGIPPQYFEFYIDDLFSAANSMYYMTEVLAGQYGAGGQEAFVAEMEQARADAEQAQAQMKAETDFTVMRVYIAELEPRSSPETTLSQVKQLVGGLRIRAWNRDTEDGGHVTLWVGLHPLRMDYVEAVLAVQSAEGHMLVCYVALY